MLVAVAILLLFSLAVRLKWRSAAVKDEILRLVVMTSEEEAEIEKMQAAEELDSFSPLQRQPQLESRHHCAVCYSATTTRCSQCKAVRYCSGKCQIIHWRQGHKDDCVPTKMSRARKISECIKERASENQFEIHSNDKAKLLSDPLDECDGIRSPDKASPAEATCHMPQSTGNFDDANAGISPSFSSNLYCFDDTIEANNMKRTAITKTDDCIQSTSFIDESAGDGDIEDRKNQAHPSSSKVTRSMSLRGSNNHHVPNINVKHSHRSKSLRTSSSVECLKNGVQICDGKEKKSMSIRSSENYQKMSTKTGSRIVFPVENENGQILSPPTRKSLKTPVSKFVQRFRAPKQSNTGFYNTRKDVGGDKNWKILFQPKLFMQLYSSDVELQPFGLVNCGNSCYANAVLQCLTFTRPITLYLLQGLHSKTCCTRDWCFLCEFECLVRKGQMMNCPLSSVGVLSHIHRIGNLSRGREEDAHEFLRNVVDTMKSVCLEEVGVSGSVAGDLTFLDLTFGGYLQSKIKCLKCSGISEQYDPMLDLAVEIDGDIRTLEEALVQFTTYETLSGDDKYVCNRCKSYQKANKNITVLEAPNILTIALKRFRSVNLEKLNKLIDFPEVLNLAPYMSGMGDKYPIYHLYAVIVHLNSMNAAYSGHYVSYVKDFRGDWFRIDDSMVTPVHLDTVLSVEAYILFYARYTPRDPSLPCNKRVYSEGQSRRSMEAISSNSSSKKKNSKTKSSPSGCSTESTISRQPSDRHPSLSPKEFTGNHIAVSEGWGFHSKLRNRTFDTSSDSSSIFSVSDAGSCSTDSTRDSSAEDISGYFFGYH